ncbi:MAG: helix-turn-helix domain-containing protein [Acidobacteriota bacterium]|nr:helix-turn-helix domain-containing protein [Acidobacteriota bacterium]
MEDLITTREAAEKLGVSMRRVTALIKEGRLPSTQIGREHLINESDLELVRERKAGRPPKAKVESEK